MAKNKESFVLYTTQAQVFQMLTDEQAGKLIKIIFDYVCDKNPKESDDLMVNYGFQIIKQQLINDLLKWKDTCKKRSESVNKRWSENTNDTNEYKRYKSIQNIQMNTKDTDMICIDNDNDNDMICNECDSDNISFSKEVKENSFPSLNCIQKNESENISQEDKKTSSTKSTKKIKNKVKHEYGNYKRIRLTDDEYSKLCNDYTKSYADKVIEVLDEQIQMTNNKNKWSDHYLVIKKAIRDNWSIVKNIKVNTSDEYDQEAIFDTSSNDELDLSFIEVSEE